MKDCTKHWWMLRLASLPLIPLFFYFLTQKEHLAARNRMEFVNWVKQPLPAGALLVFIACAFYHAQLGMEEIIEDYIPAPGQKKAALLVNKLFFSGLGLASLYAVLAINFGKA
jgi:succinate dehydrogenase / fumarate reductase membrane anchor subunit